MPAFAVDLDRLDDTVALIAARSRVISEQLEALDARIATLQQVWTGAAADAQLAAHREWAAGAQDLRDGLDVMRVAAWTAHENYSAAIAANMRMWA